MTHLPIDLDYGDVALYALEAVDASRVHLAASADVPWLATVEAKQGRSDAAVTRYREAAEATSDRALQFDAYRGKWVIGKLRWGNALVD